MIIFLAPQVRRSIFLCSQSSPILSSQLMTIWYSSGHEAMEASINSSIAYSLARFVQELNSSISLLQVLWRFSKSTLCASLHTHILCTSLSHLQIPSTRFATIIIFSSGALSKFSWFQRSVYCLRRSRSYWTLSPTKYHFIK